MKSEPVNFRWLAPYFPHFPIRDMMNVMFNPTFLLHLLFYVSLGLLPSLIWLSFYLKKDKHPEPNSIVIKLFGGGILVGPLAVFMELILVWVIFPGPSFFATISPSFERDGALAVLMVSALIPAFSEEYLKYAMVKFRFLRNAEFDEPTDVMLYCIIVGLGFAAIENLVVLFKITFPDFGQALTVVGLRFLGATLVHALACGMTGYWLALGLLHTARRTRFVITGLTVAIAFHACYNYLVMTIYSARGSGHEIFFLTTIAAMLIIMAVVVSVYFKKLRRQLSICYIKKHG